MILLHHLPLLLVLIFVLYCRAQHMSCTTTSTAYPALSTIYFPLCISNLPCSCARVCLLFLCIHFQYNLSLSFFLLLLLQLHGAGLRFAGNSLKSMRKRIALIPSCPRTGTLNLEGKSCLWRFLLFSCLVCFSFLFTYNSLLYF